MAGHPEIYPATPVGIDLTGIVVNDTQGPSFFVVSKSGGGTFKVSSLLNLQGFLAAFFVGAAGTLTVTITYYFDSLSGAFPNEGTLGTITTTLGAGHLSVSLGGGIVSEQYTDATALSIPAASLPLGIGLYEITAKVSVPGIFGPMNAFTTPGANIEVLP